MDFLTTGLKDIPWISHGFFTRRGGVSSGVFDSLNCGLASNDKVEDVRKNRDRVAAALDLASGRIATPYQVHSATAVRATAPWQMEEMPQADAVVTDQVGLGIGVLTADCVPVIFASQKNKVIGVAHAGWKGALGGVLESTIAMMKEYDVQPADIAVAIGPCIGKQSYEVNDDFKLPFLAQDPAHTKFFYAAAKQGHLMFDLSGYVVERFKKAGVETIFDTQADTLSDESDYFSYRRACLRQEQHYGRQMSVIALKS